MLTKEQKRLHNKKYQTKNLLEGRCANCGKPRSPGSIRLCQDCLDMYADAQVRLRVKRLSLGLCARCGKRPFEDGSRRCQICINREKTYLAKKREKVLVESQREIQYNSIEEKEINLC